MMGASVRPDGDPQMTVNNQESLSVYQSVCEERDRGHRPVLQIIQRLEQQDDLFYENVTL